MLEKERLKILTMLDEKKITVEEAGQLLTAIEPSTEKFKYASQAHYFIAEVSNETGIEPSVLRFWETVFGQLRPQKDRDGRRIYRDNDIDLIKEINHLIKDKGLTITAAKKKLAKRHTG